jgi:hypothetical protein
MVCFDLDRMSLPSKVNANEKGRFQEDLRHLYQPSAKAVVEIDVLSMNFLLVDGEGDPNTSKAYAEAVEALFAVSSSAKFIVKKGPAAIDYGVMPLERLWWTDDLSQFSTADKANWKWTRMIMQPPPVTKSVIKMAQAAVSIKKGLMALAKLRFEGFAEGSCAQTLHLGPFSEEGPTIERVHQFIQSRGGKLRGKHHEIYLSDIRKAAPVKWKTVLRQPFR